MLKLQELRTTAGLTQKELAEKIGVKNYTVANWEQNRTEPSIKDLIDLANYFECSIDYLLGRENDFGQIVIFKDGKKEQAELFSLYEGLSKERKETILLLLRDLNILSQQDKN